MATLFASSSNSSGNKNSPHDVFINRHGPDTELYITGHLYSALTQQGLRVFLVKEEMKKGDVFDSQIAAAIRAASVHIAIFSPRYAESVWCLNELPLMLESMESGRSIIIPIFYHVKPAHLRCTSGNDLVYAKALWILQHQKTTDSKTHQEKPRYDSYVMEKWRYALSKVANIVGFDIEAYNGAEWELVRKVVRVVLEKLEIRSLDVSKNLIGLDEKVKGFEELLEQQTGWPRVMGIVGRGGVGKTTLATEIFDRLRSNFQHSSYLFDITGNSLTIFQSQLLKDLSQLNVQIHSIDEGKKILRSNLSSKQAIIILDNVDHAQQLEALLLPTKDVLHFSSLILVTSRHKQLLINQDIKESSIYKLKPLDQEHSRELFCLHAFGQPHPLRGFEILVEQFLNTCYGLPLILQMFGRLLRGRRNMALWQHQLDIASKVLPDDIQSKLKIVYDSLTDGEKLILLEIAWFFLGEDKDTAIRVWDGSGWEGQMGFLELQKKFLVEVDSENRIKMHDHLKDLGRDIGERQPPHRIWHLTHNFLQDLPDKSTVQVRGINLIKASSVENRAELANRFHYMRKLQLVKAESDCLDESIFRSVQSPHLIWLRWDSCPYSSLPSWIPMDSLKVLELKGSATLKTLWREDDNFQAPLQLRELNVINISLLEIPKSIGKLERLEKFVLRSASFRIDLTKLPDEFCHMQCLQHLEIMNCSMKSLPNSFGNLTNLQNINFSNLSELKGLPNSIGNLRSLQQINLSHCFELRGLPDSFEELKELQHIDLSCCSKIKRLPNSFGNLGNLRHINLSHCFELRGLPDSFGELKNLEHIDLSYCSKIKRLPDSFGKLQNLQHIKLSECFQLQRLSNSFEELKNLQHIDLAACDKLNRLPDSFGKLMNLQHISLSHCYEIERLPDSFGELKNLQNINLSNLCKLKMLPNSFGNLRNLRQINMSLCFELKALPDSFELKNLEHIDLSHCSKIEELPHSFRELKNLQHINLSHCSKIEKLHNSLAELKNLQHVNLSQCFKLERLPDSFGDLENLKHINLSHCAKIERLPDSFVKLKKLEHINLSHCSKIERLPDSFVELKKLQYINLSHCSKIEKLPDSFGELKNLQHVDLSQCSKLEGFPTGCWSR